MMWRRGGKEEVLWIRGALGGLSTLGRSISRWLPESCCSRDLLQRGAKVPKVLAEGVNELHHTGRWERSLRHGYASQHRLSTKDEQAVIRKTGVSRHWVLWHCALPATFGCERKSQDVQRREN